MLQPLAKYFTLAESDYYVIQFSEQLLMDNAVEDSDDFTVALTTPTTAQVLEYTPNTL